MRHIHILLLSFVLCTDVFAAYNKVYNYETGVGDFVGINVSSDVAVPCPSGQVMVASGGGSWACGTVGGSGSPGGADTQVQFNDSSSFGGDAGLTYVKATDMLTLAGSVTLPATTSSAIGVIYSGANRFMHNYSESGSLGNNTFTGKDSGNFTLSTGGGSTDLASFNDCYGSQTCQDLTTGQNNAMFGYQAGKDITSGTRNSGFGYTALYQLTEADYNNAIGDAALGRVTTGDGNNALGYVAGYKVDTGQHNIFIGSYAGYGSDGTNGAQTDDFGILIGYLANRSVVAATKLSNYIGIGQSVNIDASNTVKIGNDSMTNSMIMGDALSIGESATETSHPKYYTYYDWDDSSNYSRGVVGWDGSSNMIIGTQSAGTGSNLNVLFQRNGSTLMAFTNAKITMHDDINFSSDNTRDIGTTSAAVRRIYLGTDMEVGHDSDTTLTRSSAGVIAAEGVAIPTISNTATLTNKRITKRVASTTDDATAVIDSDSYDEYVLTAVANATEFTVTGTPTDGQTILIRFKDAGVAKALTWTGITALGVTLPTTTVAGKWHLVGIKYFTSGTTWYAVGVSVEA